MTPGPAVENAAADLLDYGMPRAGIIKAYHAAYEPFQAYDWSRLGETTLPNVAGQTTEPYAMNLAKLGPWASEKDVGGAMGATHSLPVDIGGKGKSFASLDALESYVRKAGGPEAARSKLTGAGYGHVVVNDEEFGGKSYIALSPEHFTINQ
jgi:hypothetical protein